MTEERRAVPAKKAAKAAAFLLPFAVMILVISAFGIRYHTNDDATLANIAAGGYGDTLHMVYVNMLFSLLLRPLYALKRVNWYVIVQLALVCLSLAAAGLVLVKRCGALRGTALAAGLTLPFAVHLFYYFQYTKNAAVMSAAGLLLIARDLGTMGGATWAGIVLALAGSLVRFESFALAGALFAAPLLLEFFRLDGNGKKKAAGAVIVLLALVFARKGADRAFYRKDEGWRRFRQYNRARTRFSDHKVYLLGEENSLGGAGVSDTDYTMLKNWDFFDREHFTSEYLDRISSEIEYPSYADSLKSLPGRLKEPAITSYGLGAAAALLLALGAQCRTL